MFFFAIFAGCRHTRQFNMSLMKSFHRATNQHKKNLKKHLDQADMADMSMSTTNSKGKKEDLEMADLETQKKVEAQFVDYFSFGKYLELHQRVEYLENELDKQGLVKKRLNTKAARLTESVLLSMRPMKMEEEDDTDDENDSGDERYVSFRQTTDQKKVSLESKREQKEIQIFNE